MVVVVGPAAVTEGAGCALPVGTSGGRIDPRAFDILGAESGYDGHLPQRKADLDNEARTERPVFPPSQSPGKYLNLSNK